MILIKRVKLLRVFRSFPFYFVYFSSSNIIKRKISTQRHKAIRHAHNQATLLFSLSFCASQGKKRGRKVSVTFSFLCLHSPENRTSKRNVLSRFQDIFSTLRTLLTIMTSVMEKKIDFSPFLSKAERKKMFFCHATSVNLTLINNQVNGGRDIRRIGWRSLRQFSQSITNDFTSNTHKLLIR